MLYRSSILWGAAGVLLLLLLPLAVQLEFASYNHLEPFLVSPVPCPSRKIALRKDGYGKGYFGAPRNGRRKHMGIDIAAPLGTPILASKSGRVVFSGEEKNGFGKYVEILHPGGLRSFYAHLSLLSVSQGQWVEQREVIGQSGKTGNAKSIRITPHLHFEIHQGLQAVDPLSSGLDPSLKVIC